MISLKKTDSNELEKTKAWTPVNIGEFKNVTIASVTLPSGIAIRWCLACYLMPDLAPGIINSLPILNQNFVNFVAQQLSDFVFEKKTPPSEIASALMNMAEDLYKGRTIEMKTGDYIAMQNYYRKSMGK